jgi:hypothetical protein
VREWWWGEGSEGEKKRERGRGRERGFIVKYLAALFYKPFLLSRGFLLNAHCFPLFHFETLLQVP